MTFGIAAVGGDSITAICDRAAEAPQELLAPPGCRRDPFTGLCHPPGERTIRRVPADVNHHTRQHRGVENREYYVRDVTFREDAGQVRTGQLPHVMAAIRNLVIGAFRQKGHISMAQARRRHGCASRHLLTLFAL